MLYTGKGDDGTTKLFDSPKGKRSSKSDFIFEVLGTLDELNSSIGYAKVLSRKSNNVLVLDDGKISYEKILEKIQQNLFCIQAEVGGSDIHLSMDHVYFLEKITNIIETLLPPIKNFVIAGGGDNGAYLDIVRTIARRTERSLVSLQVKEERIIKNESLIFLNRLSSALYALARYANYQEGFLENNPNYK